MKKAIIMVFTFAFLFVGQNAFASALWNGASNDCQTLTVANFTTQTGYANPCWPLSSVQANTGDSVNVRLYYHNSSDLFGSAQTATNVRVVLNVPTGSSTSQTITGQIISDQGSIALQSVTVNTPTATTLSFSETRWYPNQQATQSPLLNGQSGSAFVSGGLNIGTIQAGWASQGSVAASFYVNGSVTPPPTYNCAISNFTANGSNSTTVQANNPVTIAWNTTNCDYVIIVGPGIFGPGGIKFNPSGNQTIYPTNSGTYTLNAYGSNGQIQTQTVYVSVNSVPPPTYNCTISNFTANGSTGSIYVNQNQPVTITWNTNNCNSVSVVGPGLSNNSQSGSQTVYPMTNGSYVLNAYGSNGQIQTQTLYVNVNQIVPPPANSCAVTTVATNISQTSATINGLLTTPNYSSGNTYFEYGPTVALGYRTTPRFVSGGSTPFAETLTGLNPDTIYFYRIASDCLNGTSRGTIEIFSTLANRAPRPIVVQGTTVTGTQSPIMLKIEGRFESIGAGDGIDYAVSYKNISKAKLTTPVLQVVVPKGITLTNASKGTYSNDTNTLTVPLADLAAGDNGVIYVQGHVDSIPSGTAQIVSTAILVYTNTNGAQENAIAYVLNKPKTDANGNVLGAAALFGGIMPTSLAGWLVLIMLAMLVVLVARSFAKRAPVMATNNQVPLPPTNNQPRF